MTGIEGLFDDEQPTGIDSAQEIAAPEPESKGDPAPEPETATPAVSEPKEDRFAPLSALLDERDKRQAAQRQAEELQRKLAQFEAQQAAPQAPDFYEDPEGRINQALWNERLNTSELVARNTHGDAKVDEAREAFLAAAQKNPALQMELRGSRHPYDFVVSWHKRTRALSEIGDDPDAYRAKLQEEIRQQVLAEFAQAQPQKPAAPPPSLASAASAGGAQTETQSGFERLFGG